MWTTVCTSVWTTSKSASKNVYKRVMQWRKTSDRYEHVLKNSAPLQVHAHWDPIADATHNLHKNSPENVDKKDAILPNEPIREYRTGTYQLFSPRALASWRVFGNWIWIGDIHVPFAPISNAVLQASYRNTGRRGLSPVYADVSRDMETA